MSGRILSEGEEANWNEWLRTTEGANSRQTSFYRSALKLYGHRSEIIAVEEAGQLRAGALLGINRPASFVGPIIQSSGGVALDDAGDPDVLGRFLSALLDRASDLRASSVDIHLRVPKRIGEDEHPAAAALEVRLRDLKFALTEPLGTYFVRLDVESEQALLEGFGKNPRRHIRKALRDGLIVERTTDPADIEEFLNVRDRLYTRKGLGALPKGMASAFLRPLIDANLADLFVARFQGTPRNYIAIDAVGQPVYNWGALAEAACEPDCPPTGQALHYAAMCHFRTLGRVVYDFGGSPGPVPEPGHSNFDVWKFKHEFEGSYVWFLGHWRRILRPTQAALLELLRQRGRVRSLLRLGRSGRSTR